MKTPESSTVISETGVVEAEEVASEIITSLDKKFNREDVSKISEWVHYLSTQS